MKGFFFAIYPHVQILTPAVGTVIFNAAPGIPNLDEKIFRLSDIFCVNETEVSTNNWNYRIFDEIVLLQHMDRK